MTSSLTRALVAGVVVLAATAGTLGAAGPVRAATPGPPAAPTPSTAAASIPPEDRDRVLGAAAARTRDRVWTTTGDAAGVHVLVADTVDGFKWRTIATISEPGYEIDRWVANACVTQSGDRVALSYAPRSHTNDEVLFARGAFTAVVDLRTGAVRKLPVLGTLAYFSPGCGSGEQVTLTTQGGTAAAKTRVVQVDTVTGQVGRPVVVPGQLTSSVPTPAGTVAADDGALVRLTADGGRVPLVATSGTASELTVDRDGGVLFVDHDATTSRVHRLTPAQAQAAPTGSLPTAPTLASGPLAGSGLLRAPGGRVFLAGGLTATTTLPEFVRDGDLPLGARPSRDATVAATAVEDLPPVARGSTDPTDLGRDVQISVTALGTGTTTALAARSDDAGPGGRTVLAQDPSPATSPGGSSTNGSPVDAIESERTCAVSRNDPANQALQPKPRQVEWAVDQAVTGSLTVPRPANWKNLAMPAYRPQGLFPSIPLAGGGRVPAQVMLGILAQESNLWQAPGYVVPGVTGNPLIGNYYGVNVYNGTASDDFAIDLGHADCGYGVAQVTDGMRLAGRELDGGVPAYPYQTQRAVALDFATNVAAGLRILQQKWNETYNAGLRINNADPSKIENWFFAVWAYNSGFKLRQNAAANNGAWGVGWANNPVNPNYPSGRLPFLENSAQDARNPQYWPYPEKVMGWAGHPVEILESPEVLVPGFRAAWWNGDAVSGIRNRAAVKPPVNQFCTASNSCYPGQRNVPTAADVIGEPAGPCAHRDAAGRFDLKCWFNKPSTWKTDCSVTCGNELLRFDPGYAYQDDGSAYPPDCSTAGLPPGALIVDDVPAATPVVRTGCQRVPANAGTFSLTFGSDAAGNYPSKTDFHQLGAGFNGHFWFAHTRADGVRGGSMDVNGTWTLGTDLHQWARVLVHLPDHGAHTQQADYVVDLGNGASRHRVILQRVERNEWASLGVFPFDGTPRVRLGTVTRDGDPDSTDPRNDDYDYQYEDIAWDAVAFQPLARKPANVVVALGDSYSSGEGGSATGGTDYYRDSDNNGDDAVHRNACHRSPYTWSRGATLADAPGVSIGSRADSLDPALDYHLLACSGAETENLMTYGGRNFFDDEASGQYGELSQLERGFVDVDTTLVTLSVGGNDAGFSSVVKYCLLITNCGQAPSTNPLLTVEEFTTARIAGPVEDSVFLVLANIRQRAPNARIVLMGYPQLMVPDPILGSCVGGLTNGEFAFLNKMATFLDQHLSEATDRANTAAGRTVVTFANPVAAFKGKGVCGNPETIHAIVLDKTDGEQTLTPASQQSFHPKIAGYANYATAFQSALTRMRL